MTIQSYLHQTIEKLTLADVPTARLDAELLVSDAIKKDRGWVIAHPEYKLQKTTLAKLEQWVDRRISHEPIAYIRGVQEFYGRYFRVSPDTLTPRPETETMVELALDLKYAHISNQSTQFLDVGTGSGCIITTLALEHAHSIKNADQKHHYIATDISEPALQIAKDNASTHKASVHFHRHDLLRDNLLSIIDNAAPLVVVANLPYVPTNFRINTAATHEPNFAIYGGTDGLKYYRALFDQVQNIPAIIYTESLPPQHAELKHIANKYGYTLQTTQDLIQIYKNN